MNITEQNKLIAEFLIGDQPVSFISYDGSYDLYSVTELNPLFEDVESDATNAKHHFLPYEMRFHVSWDWFMLVAKKVYDIISPIMDGTNGDHEDAIGDMSIAILDTDIDEANKYAVKAIKWYNETKTT